MTVKQWLGASLAANVALIGLFAFHYSQSDRPPGTAEVAASPSEGTRAPALAWGSSQRDKMLALSTLEADARAANPPPLPEFWKSDADAQLEAYRLKVDQQQEAMRQALVASYGAEAAEDPMFARLFRPLDARFSYLSSSSQLTLAKLQRARASGAATTGLPATPAPMEAAKAMDREREFNRAVRAAFTDAEYDAYRLRESLAARQLRASGVIANEHEFRAAIETLEKMESDRAPGNYLEVQRSLNDLLGPARFARFLASRDPAFQTVRSAAVAQRVQESQVFAVYETIVAAQLSVLDAQNKAGADRQEAATLIRDIITSRDARIASLVGDEPAKEILKAYSNKLMSMNQRKDVAAL